MALPTYELPKKRNKQRKGNNILIAKKGEQLISEYTALINIQEVRFKHPPPKPKKKVTLNALFLRCFSNDLLKTVESIEIEDTSTLVIPRKQSLIKKKRLFRSKKKKSSLIKKRDEKDRPMEV